MYPEDRVLVGVINRKRDFLAARDAGWYRIPRARAPRGIDAEYIAFYFSRAFKAQNGGIYYYARRRGHELVRRRDLLPAETDHSRADQLYYKLTLDSLQEKKPPVLNPTRRPISFIFTTWDRFTAAETIADLYSKADWYVERVAHVLSRVGIVLERRWEDEDPARRIAELRIQCEHGIVAAIAGDPEAWRSAGAERSIELPVSADDPDVEGSVAAIREAIEALGGPVFVNIPLED